LPFFRTDSSNAYPKQQRSSDSATDSSHTQTSMLVIEVSCARLERSYCYRGRKAPQSAFLIASAFSFDGGALLELDMAARP